MKTLIIALLAVSATAASAHPTKCYYGTAELGTVCSGLVGSWNESGKAFDQIEAYFRAKDVSPKIIEGGCQELSPRQPKLKRACNIDLETAAL